MKKRYIFVVILVVLIIACFVLGIMLYGNVRHVLDTDRIYKGIYIEDSYVGGLTKFEAYETVKKRYLEPLINKKIEVVANGKVYELKFKDLDAKLNISEAVDIAYNIGRKGNIVDRFREIKKVYDNPVKIKLGFEYDGKKLKKFVDKISKIYYKTPNNATIKRVDGSFVITPEKLGQKVDYSTLFNQLKEMIDLEKEGKVYARFIPVKPRITQAELLKIKDVLGSFTTKFDSNNVQRSENIRIAARKINGSLIMPGEVFSLSRAIGPVTVENGFKIAKVIVNNEFVDGVGGGLCQLATTMYNAVLLSQLQVIERINHSALISYVPPGRDATVASGSIDFKFKNTTNAPIYLESYGAKNTVTVTLYGENTHEGEIVKFETQVLEHVPYQKVYKSDPTLPKGTTRLSNKPQNGLKVRTYMLIYRDDRLISKKLLSTDYYKPVNAIILVGTKENSKTPTRSKDNDDNDVKTTVSSGVYNERGR